MRAAWDTLNLALRPAPFLSRDEDTFTVHVLRDAPWTLTSNPENVRRIFTLPPDAFRSGLSILRPITGQHSLLSSSEPEHMTHKRLMHDCFKVSAVARYEEVATRQARVHVARMPRGVEFAIRPYLSDIILDVTLEAILGGSDDPNLRAALKTWFEYIDAPSTMLIASTLGASSSVTQKRSAAARRPLDRMVADLIRTRRSRSPLSDDLLSVLVRTSLTDDEIHDELLTMFIAGTETTSNTLTWAMERLTRHPSILEGIRIANDALVDAVIRETMRLRPAAPSVTRKLLRPLQLEDRIIPAGEKVGVNIPALHSRSDLYPSPAVFDPWRWLDDRRPSHPFALVPFGGGARRCIGQHLAMMEMRAVLRVMADETWAVNRGHDEKITRRFINLAPADNGLVTLQ